MFIYDHESNTPHELPGLWDTLDYVNYRSSMDGGPGPDPADIEDNNALRAYNYAMEHGCVEKDDKLYASMKDINAIVSYINQENARIKEEYDNAVKQAKYNQFF